ncbi:hypothetical protein JM654_14720 [Microbacterium oxydans]|nr:hypothetical protein [Microbacterium oxydans]
MAAASAFEEHQRFASRTAAPRRTRSPSPPCALLAWFTGATSTGRETTGRQRTVRQRRGRRWASGDFDDDTVADGLSAITDDLIAKIAEVFADEDDDTELQPDEWGGSMAPESLEILTASASQVAWGRPSPTAARSKGGGIDTSACGTVHRRAEPDDDYRIDGDRSSCRPSTATCHCPRRES